jgi:Tol biopolymer transport system component
LRAAILVTTVAVVVAAASSGAGSMTSTVSFADPAWSPDGRKIAFVAVEQLEDGKTFGTLSVMNPDGSGIRTLAADIRGAAWPTWAPDSRRIAFTAGDVLYVVNVDGTGLREIARRGLHPDWSPGGRKIAYTWGHLDSDRGDILVINPDGSGKTWVAAATQFMMPTWSPDGQRLAFVVTDQPDVNETGRFVPYLVYVRQYGGRVRQLARVRAQAPDWSPDGKKIAFETLGLGPSQIRLLDIAKQRTKFLHDGSHPRWSPSGQQIVFVDDGAIYTMAADGSKVRRLTK